MGLSSFRDSMLDCEVYRNNFKIATYKGLISDSKEYNVISFEPNADIQVGDDIYCPLKNKHYVITNVDIKTFRGKQHSIEAYFENSFIPKPSTTIFNTYNPTNTIIGNQQNATLNINDCYNKFQNEIDKHLEDKEQLQELLELIKSETANNQIDKSKFSNFGNLISKHASWLLPLIADIIIAWLQLR